MKKYSFLVTIGLLLTFSACQNNDPETQPKPAKSSAYEYDFNKSSKLDHNEDLYFYGVRALEKDPATNTTTVEVAEFLAGGFQYKVESNTGEEITILFYNSQLTSPTRLVYTGSSMTLYEAATVADLQDGVYTQVKEIFGGDKVFQSITKYGEAKAIDVYYAILLAELSGFNDKIEPPVGGDDPIVAKWRKIRLSCNCAERALSIAREDCANMGGVDIKTLDAGKNGTTLKYRCGCGC